MTANRSQLCTWLPMLFFWSILFLAVLPFVEMRASDEAIMAGVARDILQNHHFLPADFQFQGRPATIFPLYPWLAALCSCFGEPTAFTVRLPSALATLGIAFLAWQMARRYKTDYAGTTAAMVVLTSLVMVRVGFRAHTETLHAFLMTAAWFCWYNYGPQRHKWPAAWGIALAFVTLDLLNVGLRAAMLFYLPLLFTRMPPRVTLRLLQPAHIVTLLCYSLAAYVWFILGEQPVFAGNALAASPFAFGTEGFFHHLATFPVKALIYLTPWGLLVWAPFCEAQRRFEPAGSLCGFLRALFFWPFLFTWLTPGASTLLLLPILAPVAVLIGIHAEIVLHRNAHFFQKATRYCGTIAALAMILLACAWVLLDSGTLLVTPAADVPPVLSKLTIAQLARSMEVVLLAIAAIVIWQTRQAIDSARLAWCAFVLFFAYYLGFAIPRDYLLMPDRVFAAKALLGTIPENYDEGQPPLPQDDLASHAAEPREKPARIYLETSDAIAAQLNGQMYYLGLAVTHVNSLNAELLEDENEIWLLSQRFPLYSNWNWKAVSNEYNLNQLREINARPISTLHQDEPLLKALFHGGIHCFKCDYDPEKDKKVKPRYRPPAKFRLYHGVRN